MTFLTLTRLTALSALATSVLAATTTDSLQHPVGGAGSKVSTHHQFRPSTIIARGEAVRTLPADIANVHISINKAGPSKENVTAEVNAGVDHVRTVLEILRPQSQEEEKSWWLARPVAVYEDEGAFGVRRSGFRSKRFGVDDEEVVEEGEGAVVAKHFSGHASVSARVEDLELLAGIVGKFNNSSSSDEGEEFITVDWIDWELSPAATKKAKAGLRVQAIEALYEEIEGYAVAFGKEVRAFEEMEETRFDAYETGFGGGGDAEELSRPQPVEATLHVKGKFVLG